MRIIYIITLPDLGGAQVHLLTVASEMGRERICEEVHAHGSCCNDGA